MASPKQGAVCRDISREFDGFKVVPIVDVCSQGWHIVLFGTGSS